MEARKSKAGLKTLSFSALGWALVLGFAPSAIGAPAAPFRDIQLPIDEQSQTLCFRNAKGQEQASGPIAWLASQKGACTGMSLVVGAALSQTRAVSTKRKAGVAEYSLATRLARMGCSQKVLVPAGESLYSTCSADPRGFADLTAQQNAVKVLSEISAHVLDQALNPSVRPEREEALRALQRVYGELKAGRPALLVLEAKSGGLPHTVLVTGIQALKAPGAPPAVSLSVYDSNWNYEGPGWLSRASRVLIPFDADWRWPDSQGGYLVPFEGGRTEDVLPLKQRLRAFPLLDESRGAASPEACCQVVIENRSAFSASDLEACLR